MRRGVASTQDEEEPLEWMTPEVVWVPGWVPTKVMGALGWVMVVLPVWAGAVATVPLLV